MLDKKLTCDWEMFSQHDVMLSIKFNKRKGWVRDDTVGIQNIRV